MKSTGLFGKKQIEVEAREVEIGSPGFEEVIVKIHACGVCGTDINYLSQWTGEAMPLGHEVAGEVIETGPGVTSVKPGDSVVIEDCTMCGTCADCKNGRSDLCRNMFGLSGQSGMGQYLRVRHNSLVPFNGLSYTAACLTEPLAVALNAVLRAEIPPNGSVAVLGCGPLGLMTAKVAKLWGAGHVAIAESDTTSVCGQARVALARKWGIDTVIATQQEELEKVVKARFPKGVDRVIVSSPPESINDALGIIAYGGIVTFFGLHFGGRNRIHIDVNHLIFHKITLRPFFAEPAMNFHVSLGLLQSGLIPASDLVTHTFLAKDARETFAAMIRRDLPVIKAVMLPNGCAQADLPPQQPEVR